MAEEVLAEVGSCYFTRPFRDGQGGTRFLSANEMYFIFAQDFGIIPDIVSRSECRVLIYKTIDNHPEFSGMRVGLLLLFLARVTCPSVPQIAAFLVLIQWEPFPRAELEFCVSRGIGTEA